MSAWMIYGGLGFLWGLVMQKCRFTARQGVEQAVLLRDRTQARTWLYTLGLGMAITALLCWLAVIDVDLLTVAPLHSGMLIGGALIGIGVGLAGALPCVMLCGLGGGHVLRSLCGLAGAAAALLAAPYLPLERLRILMPVQQGTLFQLTLRDPYLLDGRFLGLGCLGAVVCVAALFIRREAYCEQSEEADRPVPAENVVIFQPRPAAPAEEAGEANMPKALVSAQDDTIVHDTDLNKPAEPDTDETDEWRLLDDVEDPVEELDADNEAQLKEALAQTLAAASEPVTVDDMLPELTPLPDLDDDWLAEQQAERPSPMEDEALDEMEEALKKD